MSRKLALPVLVLLLVVSIVAPLAAGAATPIEDYASYQPQTQCRPDAKPGTVYLAKWLTRKYGGSVGTISRPCNVGGDSEHKEGRALDWSLDATKKADRKRAGEFLADLRATDKHDNPDALARRMGVMYVIWNDTMYPAWNQFRPQDYLSSGCKSRNKCSKTLRHRDHLHLSLSRPGGKGTTSWFAGRIDEAS